MMTKDWSPLRPAAEVEQKYHAPSMGDAREVYVGGPREGRADRRQDRMTEPSGGTRKVRDKR